MLPCIVVNFMIFATKLVKKLLDNDLIERFIFPLSAFDESIKLLNVSFVMFSMMKFKGLFGNGSMECIFGERKFRKFEHEIFYFFIILNKKVFAFITQF